MIRATDLANFIHEHKFDCPDPKSGHGADCPRCLDLAVEVLNFVALAEICPGPPLDAGLVLLESNWMDAT